jgi:hypothetical protein
MIATLLGWIASVCSQKQVMLVVSDLASAADTNATLIALGSHDSR